VIVDTGAFQALTAQVAGHGAAIEELRALLYGEERAFAAGVEHGRRSTGLIIGTFNRARLERQAELAADLAAAPSRRPRHLRVMDGGQP
jgi:hypothetical protein